MPESDASADASIGDKDFAFRSGSRIGSLSAGFVIRAVYDGTRFLLGSIAAAVLDAGAVSFASSNPSYAWAYTAPMCLAVIEGAGGGGGRQIDGDFGLNEGSSRRPRASVDGPHQFRSFGP